MGYQMKITQLGKELDREKYIIDKKAKSFSTTEDNLVLDFSNAVGWVFNTSLDCTFKTGSRCTFNTGSNCTFKTGSGCTFKTGSDCVAVRRDIYEVIEIPEGKKIKINSWGIKGWVEK